MSPLSLSSANAAAATTSASPAKPPPRILHLLHVLPVQAVLLDLPQDAKLSGASLHYSTTTGTHAPPTPGSPSGSRRHSRASTFSSTSLPATASSAPAAPPQEATASHSANAVAAAAAAALLGKQESTIRASALVQALGEIQARRNDERLGTLKLLHPRSAHQKPTAAATAAAAAAAAAPVATSKKWGIAARRGHSALYAGIQSLAGRAHAPAMVDPNNPESASAAATGAAAAGSGYKEAKEGPVHECVFIGTLGPVVDKHGRLVENYVLTEADKIELTSMLWDQQKCVPIFLDHDTAVSHYEGYCKATLWPLFHYVLWDGATDGRKELKDWDSYTRVNQTFAAIAAKHYVPGDLVWVHDYHLLLTPSMLRTQLLTAHPTDDSISHSAPIGLFIHTPFPSSEIFRCLTKRTPLLEGILGASLVGFQTYSYARHFVSCCTRVLGLESSPTGVDFHGHHVAIGIFPIGIDAARTEEKRTLPSVLDKTCALRDMYAGKKIIVGRDKLDSMRGVIQKLKAFSTFLDQFPSWRGKVVLVQVTSPTTTGGQLMMSQGRTPGGGKLEAKVSELVAQINSRFGSLDYMPVHHIHRAIAQDEFYALLTVADVGLITSLRDGMNTTAHEFCLCQQDAQSPLILSEFTGCASSLAGAILVNPWDFAGVAMAINDALTMTREEKYARHSQMMDHVTRYTAPKWARAFTRALTGTALRLLKMGGPGGAALDAHTTPFLDRGKCFEAYTEVGHARTSEGKRRMRLLCFDYDGTLSPIVKVPEMARPTPELIEALTALCRDPLNLVFIISGRDQATLEEWLGHVPGLGMSAEHGSSLKYPHGPWLDLTEELQGDDPSVWKSEVVDVFNFFTERTPGSFVEHKRHSVTWHYRLADPSFGAFQAKECQNHLESALLSKRPLELLVGKKNIEIRLASVNKGNIVKRLLATAAPKDAVIDFVFAVGDDKTDMDMFRALHRGDSADSSTSPTSPKSPLAAAAADALFMAEEPPSMAPTTVALTPTASPTAALFPSTTATSTGTAAAGTTKGNKSDDEATDSDEQTWWPASSWTVQVGPSNMKTVADWHVIAPYQVIDLIREWSGLPRVGGSSPTPGAGVGATKAGQSTAAAAAAGEAASKGGSPVERVNVSEA
ncbi:glycosyltransferase family 20-domain-containing protein [Catenaria anguillulae PL171]|uniref:Glycosyltransferase family 20-domain-containing protein n=1 Tax=Catenaria anguillulae PL171 TaxID=765915 RepID=A0A1Y2HIK7_9FUNG|nr:glycosyltransferase family 20-domain-containing protein [Catenaria anguillulae PL171]